MARTLALTLLIACSPVTVDVGGAGDADPPDVGSTDSADDSDGTDGADDSDGADGSQTGDPGDTAEDGPVVTADPSTILGHAQECAVALGRIPGFSCQTDAIEVPITVDGVVPGDDEYSTRMDCDRPAMLTGECLPWSKVGYLQGQRWNGDPDPDVDWVFTCRRDRISPGREGGIFNDVAMIGHRKSTGETCFFQSFPYTTVERAPSPMEDPLDTPSGFPTPREFWDPPGDTAAINCANRCHDNDPWIHSPYIDQVMRPDAPTQTLVPAYTGLDRPYTVVGTAFESWNLPFEQLKPTGNNCTSCHRIGTGGSCSTFADYATGVPGGYPVTDSMQSYPNSHWMPPGNSGTEATWEAQWRDDVEQLIRCCYDSDRSECNKQPIPMTPAP